MFPSNTITSDQRQTFTRLREYVGYRVRARLLPFNLAPPGSTGTVSYLVANESHLFIVVSWDCLTEMVEWYPPDTFWRGVSLEGRPVPRPMPRRHRCREFTTTAAFDRLGRPVITTRPINRTVNPGSHGTVRHVVADEQRIMVGVSWAHRDARPDWMWFSRGDYQCYLTEHDAPGTGR